MIELIGFMAAVLTTSASIPQLIKILKTKSSEDVSTIMFTLLVIGNVFWAIYGYQTGAKPILYSTLFSIIINVATLAAHYMYKNSNQKCDTDIKVSTAKI